MLDREVQERGWRSRGDEGGVERQTCDGK